MLHCALTLLASVSSFAIDTSEPNSQVRGGKPPARETTSQLDSNSAPRFLFAYAGSFQPSQSDRDSEPRTDEAAPDASKPLEGEAFSWSDKCETSEGWMFIEGSVGNNTAKIRYRGNLRLDGTPYLGSSIKYNSALRAYPAKGTKAVSAFARISGDITLAYKMAEKGNSAGAGATVGTVFNQNNRVWYADGPRQGSVQKNMDYTLDLSKRQPLGEALTTQYLGITPSKSFKENISDGKVVDIGYPTLALNVNASGGTAVANFDITVTAYLSGNGRTSLNLEKATTLDASSLTVDYALVGSGQSSPISFKAYRCATTALPDDSRDRELLGEEIATKTDDLAPGHHSFTFLKGKKLMPSTTRPFIIVVASLGGMESQAHFRKWRLGVVAHGYAGNWKELVWGFDAKEHTRAWVQRMSRALKEARWCDATIDFEWIEESVLPQPNMAAKNGRFLSGLITEFSRSRASANRGDVVDLIIIGHSRGSVVASQALKYVDREVVKGGYNVVVLLDPHPANTDSNDMLSWADTASGRFARDEVWRFQEQANDPEIAFSDDNVKELTIWFQTTRVEAFVLEKWKSSIMNLWGLTKKSGRIKYDPSKTECTWIDKTTLEDKNELAIGHNEIYELYLDEILNSRAGRG